MISFNFKELYETITTHCLSNGLMKFNDAEEKMNAILDNLIAAFVRAELTITELKDCLEDAKNGRVINLNFFSKGGDLFIDYVNPKWSRFAKELFRQRSAGLGTPNAASGMGELMFLFLGKGLSKPVHGDIQFNDEIIELKSGEDIRVMSDVQGKVFRQRTVSLAKNYGLKPNLALRTNIEACELEKTQHLTHWKKELSRLDIQRQKSFVNDWLKVLDSNDHMNEVNKIYRNGYFQHSELIISVIKILFAYMVSQNRFSKMVIINGNRRGIVIPKDVLYFNSLLDSGTIAPKPGGGDYFRVNQNNNVGWYIIAR